MLSPFKFQQFLNLGMNQGFKKALTTVRDYPSIIMLPAFSIWTYGSIEKGSCQYCQTSHQKIGLSFLNSFLNGFYTLGVSGTASSIFLSQNSGFLALASASAEAEAAAIIVIKLLFLLRSLPYFLLY